MTRAHAYLALAVAGACGGSGTIAAVGSDAGPADVASTFDGSQADAERPDSSGCNAPESADASGTWNLGAGVGASCGWHLGGNGCPAGPDSGCTKCPVIGWVDTANDQANCGACGLACAMGQWCNRGACTSSCAEGLVCNQFACAPACAAGIEACGCDLFNTPFCVDTHGYDSFNCGSCGATCDPGETCRSGTCVPCGDGGLAWWTTCGDSSCSGHRDAGVAPCTTESLNAACSQPGALCDPGNSCNSYLLCAAGDPRMCPSPCPL
jgi:hypothetical protein